MTKKLEISVPEIATLTKVRLEVSFTWKARNTVIPETLNYDFDVGVEGGAIVEEIWKHLHYIGKNYTYDLFDKSRPMHPKVTAIALIPVGDPVYLDVDATEVLNLYQED